MLLIIHILIALASLVVAAAAYLKPAEFTLRSSYVLVGLTVASGTALAIHSSAHLLQTCATGLIYLGLVFSAIISARARLAGN